MKQKTFALFGTCGGSKWREPFEKEIDRLGHLTYNPVKENWTTEDLKEEARHMASDDIIVIVITAETTSFISLAEVGFSVMQAALRGAKCLVYIEESIPEYLGGFLDSLNEEIMENRLRSESTKVRKAVKAHLCSLRNKDNWLLIPDSLEEALTMLEWCV